MMSSKGYYKKETSGQQATSTNTSSNSNIVSLKTVKVNIDRASVSRVGYDFLNPTENFIGVVECLNDIRHIPKKSEMKQDLDVVDVRIIEAVDTREKEEIINGKKAIIEEDVRYENQYYTLVLTKAVLLSKFKRLQEQYKSLANLKVVIIGLGKAEGKNYLDYYIDTYENAVKEGVIAEVK
jgi:hypothetical protein